MNPKPWPKKHHYRKPRNDQSIQDFAVVAAIRSLRSKLSRCPSAFSKRRRDCQRIWEESLPELGIVAATGGFGRRLAPGHLGPRVDDMVQFASEEAREWREALDAYEDRLRAIADPKLVELDTFYRVELPAVVAERRPEAHISQPELAKIMDWKLSRGKWRARLQSFVAGLSDDEVRAASRKAFAALPNLKEAIAQLSVLKGVGPATASAVLAAYAPAEAPFMSDEAMVAAAGSAKDYTLKSYLAFADKLREKAHELSKSGETMENFTPSDVERALWSTAAASMPRKTSKSATAGASATTKSVKRKRGT